MNKRDRIKRLFIIITVALCVGLAVLFGAIQAGLF